MAIRLVEVVVPAEEAPTAERAVASESRAVVDCWREELADGRIRFGFLVDAGAAEPIVDALRSRLEEVEGFRVLLMAVEASIPRPEAEEDEGEPETRATGEERGGASGDRLGREELRQELGDATALTPSFLVMSGLSAVVCALGLWMDDVAVVIGAMVIAPLLGPLVALSLATTLADPRLALDGSRTVLAGSTLALGVSVLLGLWLPVEPDATQIALRSSVGPGHLGLALAAGCAGTLAFTSGTAAAVIGVMVAVALVPPLVAGGLMLGAGHPGVALGALQLTLVNLIGVNLAGVVTFLARGVRPHRWWEAERARRATLLAVLVWATLLAVLAFGVFLGE